MNAPSPFGAVRALPEVAPDASSGQREEEDGKQNLTSLDNRGCRW